MQKLRYLRYMPLASALKILLPVPIAIDELNVPDVALISPVTLCILKLNIARGQDLPAARICNVVCALQSVGKLVTVTASFDSLAVVMADSAI